MKKAQIGNRLYTVTNIQDYTKNYDGYNPKLTAIEGHGLVMPIRSRTSSDVLPGYYFQRGAMCCNVIKPPEDQQAVYDDSSIIDYTKADSIGQIFELNDRIKDIQQDIFATDKNILCLNINPGTAPAMRALKEAINAKHIDINMYQDAFGATFQNDKRLLSGDDITLNKLNRFCEIFGIEAELTLRDIPGNPNPMNTEITVSITNGGDYNEES